MAGRGVQSQATTPSFLLHPNGQAVFIKRRARPLNPVSDLCAPGWSTHPRFTILNLTERIEHSTFGATLPMKASGKERMTFGGGPSPHYS